MSENTVFTWILYKNILEHKQLLIPKCAHIHGHVKIGPFTKKLVGMLLKQVKLIFDVMKEDCQVGIRKRKRKDVKALSFKVIIAKRFGFMRYEDKEQKQELVEIKLK